MGGNRLRQWLCGLGALVVVAAVSVAWIRAAEKDDSAQPKDNAYLPKPNLTGPELRTFIESLRKSPETVRERDGFADGMLQAAEKILAGKPDASLRRFALLARFEALHISADNEKDEQHKQSDERLAALAKELRGDKDPDVAAAANFYLLEQKTLAADQLTDDQLPGLIGEIKDSLAAQTLDTRHVRIVVAALRLFAERLPDDDATAELYRKLGAVLAESDDSALSEIGRKMKEGPKPATLIGTKLEISGPTLEGPRFDISEYHGKVVLLDFWATWCPGCRAELPKIKKNYDQFHSQGFEVVGVSLDSEFDKLSTFLTEQKIPWVSIIGEKKDGDVAFPLAEKYDISAIPETFLIGKDGKVIARNLRGEQLTDRLAQLLGPVPAAAKPDIAKPATAKN